jgi:hypothetical protein
MRFRADTGDGGRRAKVSLGGELGRDDYTDDVFCSRGINPEVGAEREYRRYGGELGLDPIYEADPRLEHGEYRGRRKSKRFRDWVEHWGSRSPGWAMPKNALPGSLADAPMLQIRPDAAVPGKKHGHDHAGMQHVAEECPCGVRKHSEKWMDSWPEYGYEPALSDFERDQHENGKLHRYTGQDGSPLCVDDDWKPLPFKKRTQGRELAAVGPHAHVEMSKLPGGAWSAWQALGYSPVLHGRPLPGSRARLLAPGGDAEMRLARQRRGGRSRRPFRHDVEPPTRRGLGG